MEKEYIKHLQQVKKVGTKLYIDDLHDVVPVGTILYTASPTPPNGYLICNGATVGRGTYPDLFAAIGTTYGDGDGSTTFQLPNLMDKTVWGGTGVGTEKEAGLPNIVGDYYIPHGRGGHVSELTGAFTADNPMSMGPYQPDTGTIAFSSHVIFDASRSNPIYGNSDTVQPPATVLLPVIKAFGHIANPGDLDAAKLAQDMLGYLPLSGGTMTGNIVLPSGGYIGSPGISLHEILLGSRLKVEEDDEEGSYISLRDHQHPGMPDVITIRSKAEDGGVAAIELFPSTDNQRVIVIYNDGTTSHRGVIHGIEQSGSNYVRFTDRRQICWGVVTSSTHGVVSTSFPAKFKDGTSPVITLSEAVSPNTSLPEIVNMHSLTNSGFVSYVSDWQNNYKAHASHWIAIGVWR